ncbi:MAG: NTP transferase domain-containing protein [Pseudomonadota bacterium]
MLILARFTAHSDYTAVIERPLNFGEILDKELKIISLILAAGRGTRMKGFEGNKTLLPLIEKKSPFDGEEPIIIHILGSLPAGPKAVVVHHKKQEVIHATRHLGLTYCEQPLLNGTGGALLAAKDFILSQVLDYLIITMGDVPFVRYSTFSHLVRGLKNSSMVVLGFRTNHKKQYGMLEVEGDEVRRIIEWKYWSTYPEERQAQLRICNSGIYAARRDDLIPYLRILEKNPHTVLKERNGTRVELEEYFITDLIEYMHTDGLKVGYVLAEDEDEVMGIDDLPSLMKARKIFKHLSME